MINDNLDFIVKVKSGVTFCDSAIEDGGLVLIKDRRRLVFPNSYFNIYLENANQQLREQRVKYCINNIKKIYEQWV